MRKVMNSKHPFRILLLVIIVALSLTAPAKNNRQDDDSRKAFLITRPKKPSKPVKRRPRPERIGLGYTLFQRDADGRPVRVDSSREFRTGDSVRLMIESNTDGWLYVFHAENGRDPKMIFPDARLRVGDNRISAHAPNEVPSSFEADSNFRWFRFKNQPATERLWLVVTKRLLSGVPVGKELFVHCQTKTCPWRPTETAWNRIEGATGIAAMVTQDRSFGQAQTIVEAEAIGRRDFGLPAGAPAPSVVKMNASAKDSMLVVKIDLIHK